MKFNLDVSDIESYSNVTVEGRTSRKEDRIRNLKDIRHEHHVAASSYLENNETEKICGAIISDFIQRFQEKHPESEFRNRLLIMAENEFGLSKCVCSTLKQTLLPYPSIHDSAECSEFVAHYLDYEPLKNPCHPPQLLPSPSQVLKWGIGDCFDISIVLASLLSGAGYDAYVVYGTAPEWICNRDRSRINSDICREQSPHSVERQMKTTKALNLMQCMISDNGATTHDKEITKNSTQVFHDDSNTNADALYGKRIHCWVLVKTNSRCPIGTMDKYIEPSTGRHFALSSCPYNSIHAVWNSKNYWVNVGEHDITAKVSLTRQDGWEHVFLNKDKTNCHKPYEGKMPFDPPFSWVKELNISQQSFAFKYPSGGRRTVLTDKRKVEFFAEGMQKQGIERRVTMFEDKNMLYPIQCVEHFGKLRKDSLIMRVKLLQNHCFFESYSPLNQYSMKEWIELSGEARTIKFYLKGRSDSLVSSEETFGETILHTYEERRDRLFQRIIYLVRVQEAKSKIKGRLVLPSGDGAQNTIVTKIIEKYSAPTCGGTNTSAIAIRSLCLEGKRLETHRYDSNGSIDKMQVVRSKRRDHGLNDEELLEHQRMINAEKEMVTSVRNLHQEILELVRNRKRDEDTLRSGMSDDCDKKTATVRPTVPKPNESKDSLQTNIDYLSPYLFFVEDVNNISKAEAQKICDSCVATMKERLLERANIIQNRLNEEHDRLDQSQTLYQQQDQVDTGSEQRFEKLCGEIAFKTKILERRLQEHEESSLAKLRKLEHKLKDDPRLKALYI